MSIRYTIPCDHYVIEILHCIEYLNIIFLLNLFMNLFVSVQFGIGQIWMGQKVNEDKYECACLLPRPSVASSGICHWNKKVNSIAWLYQVPSR